VNELERLAKAILENRVSFVAEGLPYSDNAPDYRIVVDPDPEQEAIDSIKRGKP